MRLFKQLASDFLPKLLLHLLEKFPLKQAVLKSAMSLNLVHMANKAKVGFTPKVCKCKQN